MLNFKEWIENAAEFTNSLEWQHGSDALFQSFDNNKIGSRTDPGFFGSGHYFVEKNTDIAPRWGKHVYNVITSVKNPLVITNGITEFDQLSKRPAIKENPSDKKAFKEAYKKSIKIATNNLKSMGYDSVLIKKSDGSYQLVVFDAKDIKISL